MLDSVKIQRRQSEIRQSLAELSAKDAPGADELRSMEALDAEYRGNETRFRAALIAEDTERREAGSELETRGDRELAQLMGRFELRQIALALDEGRALSGATAEVVEELRSAGGYRGLPVPWAALERRAGETLAAGVPDPIQTRPIIDRLFPQSVAARMGGEFIAIDSGSVEWPVVTSSVTAGWANGELAPVPGPVPFTTVDRALKPDHTLGIQMRISRKAMKQSGAALEAAVRRDMLGAMQVAIDKAVFLGSGLAGEPLGLITGAAVYGITQTDVGALASWGAFRAAITRFMVASAAASPGDVRVMLRPELWDTLDESMLDGTAISAWDRMVKNIPASNISMTPNALPAPAGDPIAAGSLLTTSTGGVPPFAVGAWGAVDLVRDPFSDAQSGGLRLTALATLDVAVLRPQQIQILAGIGL